jgi:hypothetical protein
MEVGTLYPFSRNHNSLDQLSQEPYALGPEVLNISIASLHRRYTLLPYFYTLFAHAYFFGGTVWRPLFFTFSNDVNTFDIDLQFMIGDGLLVSPVVTENATNVTAYFPASNWYSYYDGSLFVSTGQSVTLQAPLDFIPIHVRGGSIIPTQGPALTTVAARQNPFGLIVALNSSGFAEGHLYLDDGESLTPDISLSFSHIWFTSTVGATGGSITALPPSAAVYPPIYVNYTSVPALTNITIFGVPSIPSQPTFAGATNVTFVYDSTIQKLTLTGFSLNITAPFNISWGPTVSAPATTSTATTGTATTGTATTGSAPTTGTTNSTTSARSATSLAPERAIATGFGVAAFVACLCTLLGAM